MQENEFEKQVKQLMGEFSVTPPDEAWAKISSRLGEKRRRRLPFIFLFVMAGLMAAGFWYFYAGKKESLPASEIVTKATVDSLKNDDVLITADTANAKLEKPGTFTGNSVLASNKSSDKLLQRDNVSGKKNSRESYNRTTPSIIKNEPVVNHVDNNNVTAQQHTQAPVVNEQNTTANNNNTTPLVEAPANNIIANADTEKQSADSNAEVASTSIDSTVVAQSKTVDANSNAAKKVKHQNTAGLPKWQFGVNASYGINNAVNSLDIQKSEQQYASLSSPSSIVTGDTIFNKYAYTSSSAYSFGVEVQRSLSKKILLGAGLNFTHLSTKSDVRTRVDSNYTVPSLDYLVSNYYQPGKVQGYTNSYNFIELPVYFQQNLLQHQKFAFGYNAGFSLRQLISTKSLIYNANNNIYFSKDDALRKTQFQLQAGLNFSFKTGRHTAVYAGPQFSYGLSGLMKNTDNGNYHFLTYGLKAGLLFHKK